MPKELEKILQKKYQTLYETCSAVLQFISAQEEYKRLSYFTSFLQNGKFFDLPVENPETFLSEEVKSRITGDVKSLCARILENLIKENVPEEDFYKKLWEKLCDNTLLSDNAAKTAFLTCLFLDARLPYFHLEEGLSMDNDTFQATFDNIQPQLRKAYFILAAPFKQKTQRASLLLELADELDGDEKVVFWAIVISYLIGNRSRPQAEQGKKGQEDAV